MIYTRPIANQLVRQHGLTLRQVYKSRKCYKVHFPEFPDAA